MVQKLETLQLTYMVRWNYSAILLLSLYGCLHVPRPLLAITNEWAFMKYLVTLSSKPWVEQGGRCDIKSVTGGSQTTMLKNSLKRVSSVERILGYWLANTIWGTVRCAQYNTTQVLIEAHNIAPNATGFVVIWCMQTDMYR